MSSDLQTLASKFTTYVRLHPYDQPRWFRRCYSSVQRTVHGGLGRSVRRELRSRLFDGVTRLEGLAVTQEAFAAWHGALLDKIQGCSGLRLGQAQKLINLLLKYHYAYFHADIDQKWAEQHQFIEAFSPFFHVPIDVYVLVSLKRKYGYPLVRLNASATYATLRVGNRHVAWSRLTERVPYEHVQAFIQGLTADRSTYVSPLHFEMQKLWILPQGA